MSRLGFVVYKSAGKGGGGGGFAPAVLGFSVMDWPGSRNLTGGENASKPLPRRQAVVRVPVLYFDDGTTAKLIQLKQVDNERPDLVITTIRGTLCCAPSLCFF
jgi:hypothetical protein